MFSRFHHCYLWMAAWSLLLATVHYCITSWEPRQRQTLWRHIFTPSLLRTSKHFSMQILQAMILPTTNFARWEKLPSLQMVLKHHENLPFSHSFTSLAMALAHISITSQMEKALPLCAKSLEHTQLKPKVWKTHTLSSNNISLTL